ncbi:hypothetical protein GCM10022252_75980 [Streptosporangium oxazolinicum]|uniref:Uncharacterized protein n=1 Tax=Streptosporangium oxazolinicum TaxID=909287 RepID=A0ABP8BKW9_9ACTN
MGEAEQEPTRGELSRSMGRMENMITELRSEFREVMGEWRTHIASAALLSQRVGQMEASHSDQETRLRLVERDMAGRKEAGEKSRRMNMWIASAISMSGVVITLVFNLVK